jgi:hypothetical protein
MALLYLLGERTGVDEDGVPWVCDDDGAWRRGQEPRRPQLRLIRNEGFADEPVLRAAVAGE